MIRRAGQADDRRGCRSRTAVPGLCRGRIRACSSAAATAGIQSFRSAAEGWCAAARTRSRSLLVTATKMSFAMSTDTAAGLFPRVLAALPAGVVELLHQCVQLHFLVLAQGIVEQRRLLSLLRGKRAFEEFAALGRQRDATFPVHYHVILTTQVIVLIIRFSLLLANLSGMPTLQQAINNGIPLPVKWK